MRTLRTPLVAASAALALAACGGDEHKELKHILDNPKALSRVVVGEIDAIRERFADARRTIIEAVARRFGESAGG